MGILSAVKGIGRPLKKFLPSKTTLSSYTGKIKNANVYKKMTSVFTSFKNTKVGNLLKKSGSIFKTKGGKIGLGVVAGLGLAAGIAYLLANNKETDANKSKLEEKIAELTGSKPKNDNSTVNNVPEEKPDATRVEKPVIVNTSDESDKTPELKDENQADPSKNDETEKTSETEEKPVNAEKPSKKDETSKSEETDKTEETNETEAPKQEEKEYHDVVTGDNVWNIAKKHLKDIHKGDASYKPSTAEVAKHTEELIKINNLKYEKDNYTVIIKPGEKIQLVA